MNWYLAKIVYRIVCGSGAHGAQFDEQLRLVQAAGRKEAFERAQAIGRAEQVAFENNRQQLVQWKFINVCDVYALQQITDGAEIYSRIEEKDDALRYEDVVHAKAHYLLQEVTASPLPQA